MENGSTDNTFDVCKNLEQKFPDIIKASHAALPSYGEAVKKGLLAAQADMVSILECDAMNVEFLSNSLSAVEGSKADFVVASKRHPESVDRRPFKRRLLTLLFNTYLKLFFNFPGTDTHGLKTIRTDIAKKLCRLSITDEEVFQTELVLLAHCLGYRVIEMPIHIEEQRSTSVSIKKRMPKVINIIKELKKSLNRFPGAIH